MSADYQTVKLSEIADVIMGQSPKSEYYNKEGNGLPFFQGCSEFDEIYPTVKKYCSQPNRIAQKGDILMSVRAPIGTLNIADRQCCIGRGLCAIRSKSANRFVYYLLKANLDLIQTYGCGTTFRAINKAETNNLPFKVPPLPTQCKIASILSAYDDLIENNLRRIKILEEMAQALYREWFVKFRFPGHEKARMVDSSLGKIPAGWEVIDLVDSCNIVMGQSPKSEFYNTSGDGLPFHQGVTNFGPRFPTERVFCTVKNRIAETGDILFSVRAPVGRINLADKRLIVGRGLCAIRDKKGQQWFTLHQLKERFQQEDTMGGGTIFKAVTRKDVESIEFLNPANLAVQAFEEICHPVEAQIKILTEKNNNLRRTRDLLLPILISGKLDISDLDIKTGGHMQ